MEVLNQVKIKRSDSVAVIGGGKLGLLMAQVMNLISENVILIGRRRENLKIAKTFGVSETILEKSDKAGDLKNRKCDIVIDCTGTPSGLELSMDIVRPCGKIILKSTFAGGTPLNLAPLVINEVTVIGSRCGPFKDAIKTVSNGRIKLLPLVSKRFPLSRGLEAMDYAKKRGVLKVVLDIS